jgi:hypothetical protein
MVFIMVFLFSGEAVFLLGFAQLMVWVEAFSGSQICPSAPLGVRLFSLGVFTIILYSSQGF